MVKTPDELALMRLSGRMLASVFEMLDRQDLAGMSTLQVNDLVDRFITVDLAARPASKGQYGFKYVLNWSINHVVCHGVPDPDEIIRDGDIVNFDITLEKNGFIADSSKTYLVGNAPPTARRLVRVAREAMWKGIRQVRPGRIWATSASRSNAMPNATATRSCGILRAWHRPRDARGTAVAQFRGGRNGLKCRGQGLHSRAMVYQGSRSFGPRARMDGHGPTTGSSPTSSAHVAGHEDRVEVLTLAAT